MMLRARVVRSAFILALAPASIWAAELQTEHLYRLEDGEQHPEATLDEANWLVGSWSGTAFGKRCNKTAGSQI